MALLTLVPLLAVVWMAVTPQPEIWQHLWNYVLPRVLGNTLLLMLLVGVVVSVVGVPLAWLTAMCDFPGRKFFSWALVLPLAIPAYVLAFVQMGIFEYAGPVQSFVRDVWGNSRWFPDIRGSLWGLVMVLVMAFYPYVYLMAQGWCQWHECERTHPPAAHRHRPRTGVLRLCGAGRTPALRAADCPLLRDLDRWPISPAHTFLSPHAAPVCGLGHASLRSSACALLRHAI
nr:hypothetical protein [Comamonas jiangduensis]